MNGITGEVIKAGVEVTIGKEIHGSVIKPALGRKNT